MDKNTKHDNEYPDLSGVFDIDEDKIPSEIIKKADDAGEIKNRFLTSDDALHHLPEKEQKKILKERKTEKKRIKRDKRRVRLIIILSSILAVLIIAAAAKTGINEARKPVITHEKPVIQTISRYSLATGISIIRNGTMHAVFIDNDYDVHYIEPGQRVELTDESGTLINGTILLIKEEAADSPLIEGYHSLLFEAKPSTSSYAVYVSLDSPDAVKKEGLVFSFKTITQSSENALTVDSASVFTDKNQSYVWVFSSFSRTLTRVEVKTGITSDGRTQITSGIKKSDKIMNSVSCDPDTLYDGIKVKTK